VNIPNRVIDPSEVDYPESDGQPMADNTTQFRWIVTIQGGLDDLFRDDPEVFVAGDLLWYPVRGDNTIRQAPDVFAAFDRPKGHRGSYRQWVEGGVAPQVVFEIWSPSNRRGAMREKFAFYERYGVEEYYVYDPDAGTLRGWRRSRGRLREIPSMAGWISPRLGVRFELVGKELELYRPDGRKFASFLELAAQREQEQREKEQARRAAAREKKRAARQQQRAEQENQRAEREKKRAGRQKQRAEQEKQRADEQARLVEELRARLRALGEEPTP
jgi:Uma2 family endonuclease